MRFGSRFLTPMLFLAACSSGAAPAGDAATDVAPPQDGGAGADAPPNADGPVPCNSLANAASAVPVTQMAVDPPMLNGGAIADGTYFLTSSAIYTGPQGPAGPGGTSRITLQITGATIQVASDSAPTTRTEMITTSGNTFTATTTCSDAGPIEGTYSATPTTFVVQFSGGRDEAGTRTVEDSFARQ